MRAAVLVALACCACAALATAPIPSHLLKEWSQFQANDEFFDKMDAFLEEGAKVGSAGGDFEFKCETTCQLVQKATAAPAAAANSLLQTEEGAKTVEDAFYKNVDSFLQTQETSAGGDFEFKCETTCQLVQKTDAAAGAATTATPAARAAAFAGHNFLQTEAGVGTEQQATASATAQTATSAQLNKDCYRLCLNPSMNPGCDAASNAVSMLETGVMTEEELMRKNWSLGSGSGNCLNSCVHVCMAVHETVRA